MATITETAKKRIVSLMQQQSAKIEGLRLSVKALTPIPEYRLDFVEEGKRDPADVMVVADGINLFIEPKHSNFLQDVKIDYVNSLEHSGFKIENPKVTQSAPAEQAPPNLDHPLAQTIQKILDSEINPAVSGHGGYISLVDVREETAYIKMSGGCQGCGMASVTLKQGVVAAIKRAVPDIKEILDTTDHAGGMNPYYSPGK